jgi:hypothetical protein
MNMSVSTRSAPHQVANVVGWAGAVVLVVLPLVLTDRWWGFSLLGVALGIRMFEETASRSTRQRVFLRVAYLGVAVCGLVIGLTAVL